MLPQFTSDGTNFTFNIVPATIAGNSLTLSVNDDTYDVYVVKK